MDLYLFFSFLFVDNLVLATKLENLNSECLEKKKTHKIAFTSKPKKKEKKEPEALVQRLGLNLLSPTFYNVRL